MMPNFIDKIGDWNPQLLRELKGRLKFFNVAIAVATSLLLQLVVFLYQFREFPGERYSLIPILYEDAPNYVKLIDGCI